MNTSRVFRWALYLLLAAFFAAPPALAAAPAASTALASSITTSSAQLNGTGTPNGEATTGWFRIALTNPGACNDTFGTRIPSVSGTDLGAGGVAVAYSISATGLSSGQTYYYCSVVENAAGKAFGSIQSFNVPGAPLVTTTAETSLTPTTAMLNSDTVPNGASTTGYFRYASSDPGTCDDSFGTRAPTSGGSSLGSGYSTSSYSRAISGLVPNTTYWFCAIASNTHGFSFGDVLSFTTPPDLPTVGTSTPSSITGATATFDGASNPRGAATTAWFRYSTVSPGSCNDSFGTRAPSSGGSSLGSGNSTVSFSEDVTGLSQNTTYYVCAIAQNSVGTSLGQLLSFTTPAPPTAVTSAPTPISNTSATLRGAGVPNRATTTGWFRLSATDPGTCNDTFGSRFPATGGSGLGSGTSLSTYSQGASGLSAGTTYYFCAITQNAEGTAFGDVLSFITHDVPTVVTDAETSVTSTAAMLNGSATPNGYSTSGWFRYATSDPGTCSDSFGSRVPSSGGTGLGAGTTPATYSRSITGLTPNTTYWYCAIANNLYGTRFGAVRSFTTPANPPSTSTLSAADVTGTSATLMGRSNPGGATTTGWFRYSTTSPGSCNDTFGTRAPASGGSDVGSGNSNVTFSEGITGLSQDTTYYFCAISENSVGKTFGGVGSFTTAAPPLATTLDAINITSSSAGLRGSGVANRAPTLGWIRYSATNPGTCNDSFGSRIPASDGHNVGSGTSTVTFTFTPSGLSPSTTYYFCAITQNSEGTAFGDVLSFTTFAAPTVVTNAESAVTSSAATLNGEANPNGSATTGWFRFATTNPLTCSDSFGQRVPTSGGTSLGSGTSSAPFVRSITGLSPNTTYWFCAIAQNSIGVRFGEVRSFTTPAAPPTASTSSALDVTGTTATLRGFGTPRGATATGWFRYSTTSPGTCNDTFGTRLPMTGGTDLGSGLSSVAYSEAATGLAQNTTYYFCAVVQNSEGTAFGSVLSFITAGPPTATTTGSTSVGNTYATLLGSGVANRSPTNGWFRFSSTDPGTCNDTFGSATTVQSLGSGTTTVTLNRSVSGLSAGTTYYFCAITQNAEGTAFGDVLSVTTVSGPTVTTNAETSLTSTSAMLNGTANPNGGSTLGWFRYATTDPGTCSDSFGTRVPTSGGTSLGSGTSDATFSRSLTGLVPNTTYYFCAIASSSFGTAFGEVLSFTTNANPPSASTNTITDITGTTATLNGSSVPGGATTTGWFRYSNVSPGTCNDSFGTRAPTTGGTNLGSGTSTATFSENVTGLTQGTTYYVCAITQNSVGTTLGNIRTFTTPSPPTATTTAASLIQNTSARLNGQGAPNLATTTGWFRYSTTDPGTCDDTFGSRLPTSGGSPLGSGSGTSTYFQPATGLSPSTTYYFCAITQNSEGMAFGDVLSFTTFDAPTVVTNAETSLTPTGATLNGSANPNGSSASGWFRYATSDPGTCTDSFGFRAPTSGSTSLGSGTTPAPFLRAITGLTPNTTYWFCAISSNGFGTRFGSVRSFTTPPALPTASTNTAINVTGTAATFSGSSNPGGASTTGWFRYATTSPGTCNDAFGTRTPVTGGSSLGSGNSTVTFTENVAGLSQGTTYYYCAIAQNSEGTAVGTVRSFITASPPTAVTETVSSLGNTATYLRGSGIPNRATTTGWFRFSATDPGTCNDTFGSRAPETGGTDMGASATSQTFDRYINNLSPLTTYYYCAITQNSEGTAFGDVLSFTTQDAPQVVTNAETNLTATSVTFNASTNPNGNTAYGWFRYTSSNPGVCNDVFGSRVPTSGNTSLGSVTTPVDYSRSLTGLTPNTTYWFCAISTNTHGTRFGELRSFTTPADAPTASTGTATSVTTTSARLNASSNPRGAVTTAWFRYGTVNPGTCTDAFGTRVPLTGGTDVGSGNSSVSYFEDVTGLAQGTTYYFCAITQNSVGMSVGTVRSFTTPTPPVTTTLAATPVTATTATLNATTTPNTFSTTGWFRYSSTNPGTCNDTFGTRTPASGGQGLGAGTTPSPYSRGITGLVPATTYYFCSIVESSVGMAFGEVLSFTTAASLPAISTVAASEITLTSAVLNGTGNPGGAATTGWFRYASTNPGACSDSFGTRVPASSGTDLGSGNQPVPFDELVTGLSVGVTYYYCAIGSNSQGTTMGGISSFTPSPAPSVTTGVATSVSSTGATLNATANPNSSATTGWFRYSTIDPGTCNDSFGTRAPVSGGASLGSGTSASPYSQSLTGLAAGTTYYFCAIAENSIGTSTGAVQSFTTAAAPTVATTGATNVVATTATLTGTANPRGASTTGWFRYSSVNPGTCSDAFGTRAPSTGGTALGNASSDVDYIQNLSGLSPGTTYYYCAIAQNAVGTSFGGLQSFTTLAAPTVTTGSAGSITASSATLNGGADPNLADAAGWFRYSTTNPGTCNDSFGTPTSAGTPLGAGSTSVPFSDGVTGLSSGTTYYYCAIAQNSIGTGFGSVLSFTTLAEPSVTTSPASAITSSGAMLNASANPNGTAATGWFRYSTVDPGTCSDAFGTRLPSSGGQSLGSGTSAQSYSMAVTGLSAGTTYYFCAIAENTAGTSVGAVQSFTTTEGPSVTTDDATNTLATTATLNGTANPNGLTATGWFRYDTTDPGSCNDSFGTRAPTASGTSLGSGSTAVPFSEDLTGLTPGATYYFCAIAQNSVGTRFGAVRSFTTIPSVEVTTEDATNVDDASATLEAQGNPNGVAATGWFRYGTTDPGTCDDSFGTRVPTTDGTDLGSGTADVPFSEDVTGLSSGTTYYFCAIAQSASGTSFGEVLSFTTAGPPIVTTELATLVTGTEATLNATANPSQLSTTGWFRYAASDPGTCNDAFGTRVPGVDGLTLGSGSTAVGYAQALSGLAAGTTYYFCAIAENAAGISFGAVESFTTLPAPTVATVAATGVSSSSATLQGMANPNGSITTGWFRYDTVDPGACSDAFGTRLPASAGTVLGAGTAAVPFSETLTGLPTGTTYYYCAIAMSASGLSTGTVMSFTTTSGPSVTTGTATVVTQTSATLDGSANPNGVATTGWFRYSSTDPGACSDTFGTRAPASSGASLGSGSASADYTQPLTGLVPSTTYYYCAIASSAAGTGFGAVLSFRTADGVVVTTHDASDVTGTSATLEAEGTPNGSAATGWFRYDTTDPVTCNDAFGTRVPASSGTALGAGSAPVPFSEDVTGLSAGTTYYFCAIASGANTAYGEVLSFTTPTAPSATTLAATAVTVMGATLEGSSTTGLADTTAWFRYSATDPVTCDDAFGTRAPATGGEDLGADPGDVTFSLDVTALAPSTTYYFCALSENAEGTSFGDVLSLTTLALPPTPTVTTEDASGVSATEVTLEGTALPAGSDTLAWFRYDTTEPASCDDDFGTRVPEDDTDDTLIDAGEASPVDFSETVSGLDPETTYWFCAIAENAGGLAFGTPVSVTTLEEAPVLELPVADTDPASNVTGDSATLHGSVESGGATTTAWFRYDTTDPGDCDDSFGTRAPATDGSEVDATETSPVDVSEALTGLDPETTYYYCLIAENEVGTDFGQVRSFSTDEEGVTPPEPMLPLVTTNAASDVTRDEAELNGNVNPNGSATTAWFRYDTTDPGDCDDSFGTRAPAATSIAVGGGTAGVAISETIGGTPGTTVYFCVIAENAAGVAFGSVQSFTLDATLASVVTGEAADVTETGATLVGSGNPNGFATTGWFRYDSVDPGACDDTFGTRVPADMDFDLGDGTDVVDYEEALTDLEPATTYYYCAIASGPGGLVFGELIPFTTLAALPVVTTDTPELDLAFNVLLNGTVDPRGSATVGWFRWDVTDPVTCNDTFGTRVPAEGEVDLGSGREPRSFRDDAGQLANGTIYVCAIASNEAGMAFGSVVTFVIEGVPPVEMPPEVESPGGCGCRVESRSSAPGLWLGAGAFLALSMLRRRRRR